MKKLLVLFSLVFTITFAGAQTTMKPGTGMPNYRILKTDSTFSTTANLKKGRRVMLIYFAPDCPHCQRLMYEMKPKMKELGDTQIIMITWSDHYDIRSIKNFYRDFDLKKYPNLIVGTEGGSNTVLTYFQIRTTPFIAIYNPKGKLVKTFSKEPPTNDVIAAVKKAK